MSKIKKFFGKITAPISNLYLKKIVLPREERMKSKILKSARLKSWVAQLAIGLINQGSLDTVVKQRMDSLKAINKAKIESKKRQNRNQKAHMRRLKKR